MSRIWQRVALAFGIAYLAVSAAAADPAGFCRDPRVDEDVAAAAADRLDRDALEALYARFDVAGTDNDPGCGSTVAYCVGQAIALQTYREVDALLASDRLDLAAARQKLETGKARGAPWQLLDLLGDVDAALARATGDGHRRGELYLEAAKQLQLALNAINDEPLCGAFGEVRPDAGAVARIRKRTQEAVMLAPHFDIARTRSGDCGGIFLTKLRGISVESVPVPITFPRDSADFTDAGRQAASALLQCLRDKKLASIILTGHTDQDGDDAYNLALSAQRLATVDAFLKAGGYSGAVHLIARGKREPFVPDDPTQHSVDEIKQMDRRVELRESGQ